MVTAQNAGASQRNRPTAWQWLMIGAAVAIAAAVGSLIIWSQVDSLPVRVVNDTGQAVVFTDCGPDLEKVNAGQVAVFNVSKETRSCSITLLGGGTDSGAGCVTLPSPLQANETVRISASRPIPVGHSCS